MKIPKQLTEMFSKTTKKVGDVAVTATKGSVLGKGAKIIGIGGAGALAIDKIDEMVKSMSNGKTDTSAEQSDRLFSTGQDNDLYPSAIPGNSSLPTNVIPFRANKSLTTSPAIPENIPDSIKIDILEKRVGVLEEKVERFEKVEIEREQALVFARREDNIEGKSTKPERVSQEHISGKSKAMLKLLAKEAMAPALLMLAMNMGTISKFIKESGSKLDEVYENLDDVLVKLATAGIPGFALADVLRRRMGLNVPPTSPKIPSTKKPSSNIPKTSTPETTAPKSSTSPQAANDNKVSKIREKLKMLKAPKWVFDILERVSKLTRFVGSKIPFIGGLITIVLETIEQYDPDLHKNPQEFQKLLVKAIVVGLGQTLTFAGIILMFTLISGPLGTLAGVLVYVFVGDKIDDAIREELVGYLVKYVLFDEDPLEAAKKSGRYKKYDELKNDAEQKLKLAQGNLSVIENKEKRDGFLTPQEESMKSGYKAQIEGYTKRTEMLKTAQKEIEVEGQRQKDYVDAGRAKKNGNVPVGLESLKEEIASGEGDYKAFNKGRAGDSVNSKEFDLENMTVQEVMDAQSKKNLFAVGKYQFIPQTLKEAVQHTGIDPTAKFNAETQEKLFPYLISDKKRPNLAAYLEGKHDNVDKALDDLAYEFASIPDASGKGKYDGDSAGNRASGNVQRSEKIKKILMDTRNKNKEDKSKSAISNADPVPESPEPVRADEFKAPMPAEPVQIKKEQTAPVSEAPKAPPVTVVVNNPPAEPVTVRGNIEQSTQPNPGEIPSPVAGNRPGLNVSYSPY